MSNFQKPAVLDAAAFENIQKCSQSSTTIKEDCLRRLAQCGDDKDKAKTAYNAFIAAHVRQGNPPADLLPDEGLGTLVAELPFVRKTAEALQLSPAVLQRKVDSWLSFEEKRRGNQPFSEHERADAMAILTLKVPTRQDGGLWLFRNPRRKPNTFDGLLDDGQLPQRLGLILSPGQTRLTFSFRAAHVSDVRRPKFADATWDYLPYWDWRGKTKPLAPLPAEAGLEEVVAEPPAIGQVNQTVRRITISSV
ncbi:hypothetical protein [Hyphomicrobium sp. D-2]|uniref:hypothetical protein n=1 Tax=Hyphomicrobium sp. D-2 TaxID=3041621 RepID=UPI002455324D|nr:hypothetical protein [Hyphomicrobium sp. D-2]MDH4981878.1 hypothetical protein [Hyphomicrobium sp. D-2]